MFVDDFHCLNMNGKCHSRDSFKFKDYADLCPCCYNFYRKGLISIINFCTDCKLFLCSLSDFQLKKVVIAKKMSLTYSTSFTYRDKAIDFCQYILFLHNDEPIKIDFVTGRYSIKFYLYYNPETFEDVNDFTDEIDAGLNSYGLLEYGMRRFFGRLSKVSNCKTTSFVGNLYLLTHIFRYILNVV